MPQAANPVEPEHAERFEQFLLQWQEKLNLKDWRINLSPVRHKGVMAVVYKMDFEQRQATIRLGFDFGSDAVDDVSLEATALHELLHIMLCELMELAKEASTQGDPLRSAEHRVINTLERLLVLEKISHGETRPQRK
jgi:hypothetical protein